MNYYLSYFPKGSVDFPRGSVDFPKGSFEFPTGAVEFPTGRNCCGSMAGTERNPDWVDSVQSGFLPRPSQLFPVLR